MNKIDEYKRYLSKCSMLGTKMFEFICDKETIYISNYIPNDETERLLKIPDFVEGIVTGAFDGVKQRVKIESDGLKVIKLTGYKGDSIDLQKVNTSKINNMKYMFNGCDNLKRLDLSNFDTRSVEDMHCMFQSCISLEKLDLSSFDTRNTKDMKSMFNSCGSLKELDLNNFDTSNIEDMDCMFANCESLQELNLSNFDTRKVTSMFGMFYNCVSLRELDISNFNMDKADGTSMFYNCKGLRLILVNKSFKDWLEASSNRFHLDHSCKIVVK